MDKHTICLLNDSFPPIIDGVANAVVNYAENLLKSQVLIQRKVIGRKRV